MLALDSPRWAELDQAYGTAEDIPRLIAHLDETGDADRRELWFGLWSTLCHQGTVYLASYAAVPHLVRFAGARGPVESAEALHLVGAIELGRLTPAAPSVPDDLADDYRQALEEMPGIVAARVGEPWDRDTTQVLSAVLAIAKGHVRLGSAVLSLEALVSCPLCDGSHAPPGWDFDADV
jgi:hypothetical protein